MITEEVKKEIEELVREGEKLIDALRREGNNSKDLVFIPSRHTAEKSNGRLGVSAWEGITALFHQMIHHIRTLTQENMFLI